MKTLGQSFLLRNETERARGRERHATEQRIIVAMSLHLLECCCTWLWRWMASGEDIVPRMALINSPYLSLQWKWGGSSQLVKGRFGRRRLLNGISKWRPMNQWTDGTRKDTHHATSTNQSEASSSIVNGNSWTLITRQEIGIIPTCSFIDHIQRISHR